MKTIPISRAEGITLDWLVATIVLGLRPALMREEYFPHTLYLFNAQNQSKVVTGRWQPCIDLTQGWPVLEALNVSTVFQGGVHQPAHWEAWVGPSSWVQGPDRMTAGLRAAVIHTAKASRAEVPDELSKVVGHG